MTKDHRPDTGPALKRVYFDLSPEQHAKMVLRTRELGKTQRAYIADLIVADTAKGEKRR